MISPKLAEKCPNMFEDHPKTMFVTILTRCLRVFFKLLQLPTRISFDIIAFFIAIFIAIFIATLTNFKSSTLHISNLRPVRVTRWVSLTDRFSHGSRTRSRALCHGVWHVRRQYVIRSHANGYLIKTEHSWILSWYVDRTQTVHLMKTEHLSRFVDRMQTVLLIRQGIHKTEHSWILSRFVAVQNVESCERMLGLEVGGK